MPGGLGDVPQEKQIPHPRCPRLNLASASHSWTGFRRCQLAPILFLWGDTPHFPPSEGLRPPAALVFPPFHGGGGEPIPEGLGVSPKEHKSRGEKPSLATRPRVGAWTPANPQQTRVGKIGGCRGAKPPCQGVLGGVPPKNKLKGREGHSRNPPTSGILNPGGPPANEGGKRKGGNTPSTRVRRGAGKPVPPLALT